MGTTHLMLDRDGKPVRPKLGIIVLGPDGAAHRIVHIVWESRRLATFKEVHLKPVKEPA